MRKIISKALTAGAVAATTVALVAVPASASGTWTINPAGGVSGFNTQNVGALDLTTHAVVSCNESSATGNVPVGGSGLAGAGIAELTDVTFSNNGGACPATGGILVTITTSASATNAWSFNADSYNSTTHVTTGTLTNISASIHGSDGCDATVGGPGGGTGTINGTYDNDDQTLRVSGNNLVVQTADAQCDPNLINVGDQIQLTGEYIVVTDSGPNLVVTSP
ncbi:hypothetical protein [Actinomadura bangladeshensis]|uniref:DUF5666 domain-containing protein n=1 Tax=Actinomadura bangladeshensis TaxID=453573 RepID=A0A4R4NX43_9ACTN|nr:hypothetical protein [Actinomadura bangladeshensis]TDC12677.1 hypothetical protein E1284_22650 [Actinomadura bangladeshensis]